MLNLVKSILLMIALAIPGPQIFAQYEYAPNAEYYGPQQQWHPQQHVPQYPQQPQFETVPHAKSSLFVPGTIAESETGATKLQPPESLPGDARASDGIADASTTTPTNASLPTTAEPVLAPATPPTVEPAKMERIEATIRVANPPPAFVAPEGLKLIQTRAQKLLPMIERSLVSIEGGSGVIVRSDGLIFTVSHVSKQAGRRIKVVLANGRVVEAVTLGSNRNTDTGAVQILSRGPWPHLTLGDSQTVQNGNWCLALGHPYSFKRFGSGAVRLGRIQSVDQDRISSDCPIMGGDSGGPLVDMSGRLIGINSGVKNQVSQNFHVPINAFKADLPLIENGTDVRRITRTTYLGVHGETDRDRIRVRQVHPKSPAAISGLQAGDVIVSFEGTPVDAFDSLLDKIANHDPGDWVNLKVNRFGQLLTLNVELGRVKPRQRTGRNAQRMLRPNPEAHLASLDSKSADHAAAESFPEMQLAVARDSQFIKTELSALAGSMSPSVVRLRNESGAEILGTIVTTDGLVVTKASELSPKVTATLHDGRQVKGRWIRFNSKYDLGLVRIAAKDLHPVSLYQSDSLPDKGQIIISIGDKSQILSLGVVSITSSQMSSRRDLPAKPIELGAQLSQRSFQNRSEVRVTRVNPRTLGEELGLLVEDVILKFNGQVMHNQNHLLSSIKTLVPGQIAKLTVQRNGRLVELSTRVNNHATRISSDQWGGGPFSRRRFGFPIAITHDSVILPGDCGGPIVDLEGRTVGINIARSLRVATSAIPSQQVITFVQKAAPSAELKIERAAVVGAKTQKVHQRLGR